MAYGDRNRAQMLARTATSPRARWGWGPSDLASKEERDAWKALRVGRAIEQGQATEADLPEAYGGRPQGTTRRGIRMQKAWDAQQAAILAQEQEARQIEELQKNQRIKDLTIEEKEYDFRTKREDDLFNSNESVKIKAAEADLAEFANTLDPTDPTSASRLAAYIQNNPYLLNSPLAAKRYDYFTKAASNSVTVIEGQQNKAVEDAVSAALRAGLTEAQIAEFETLDQQGRETFDIGGLRRATDIVIGGRAAAAEERKEPTDTRTEVEKARDRLAEAQAALGALSAENEYGNPIIERDSPEYIRAFKDVEVARTRVERLEGAKPKPREEPKKEPRQKTGQEDQASIRKALEASGFANEKLFLDALNRVKQEYDDAINNGKAWNPEATKERKAVVLGLDAYPVGAAASQEREESLRAALMKKIEGGGEKTQETTRQAVRAATSIEGSSIKNAEDLLRIIDERIEARKNDTPINTPTFWEDSEALEAVGEVFVSAGIYKNLQDFSKNLPKLREAVAAEAKRGGQKFKEGAILVQGNRRFRVTNGEPIEIKD